MKKLNIPVTQARASQICLEEGRVSGGGDRLRLLSLPGCGPGHWRLLLSGHRLYRRRI